MPLLNYLGHAGLFLACLYGIYWLFFRKEAFHQLNRALILLIMAGTLALPLIPAPPLFQDEVGLTVNTINWVELQYAPFSSPDVKTRVSESLSPAVGGSEAQLFLSPAWWLCFVYFIGLALLACRLAFQLILSLRLLKQSRWQKEEGGWLAISDGFNAPFCFWNVIFLPADYEASPLRQYILEHERVHRRQWHSADLLLAELFCTFFWFHPAAWRLNRALRSRLEYIADEAVLHSGVNKKSYQYSLLSLAGRNTPFRFANQFNQSLIKTRIVMMNAKKSPAHYKLKYFGILPMLFLLVLAFNDARAQAQETQPEKAAVKVGIGEKQPGSAIQVSPRGLSHSGRSGASVSKADGSAKGDVSVGLSASGTGSGSTAGAGLGRRPYESVFVAIGAEFPVERLPQMKKDLKEQGILLDIEELDYNADKLITRLKLSVRTTDGKMHGNGFSYNDGKPIDEPVIFYVTREQGNHGFGIFTGKLNDSVPAEVRNVIERMENGYFVGKIITE
ncbi:MAG: M56 family metallopeptidase [Phaeodactylibacter sp.]|nr:M56 family metallopeptidase [Phaeodactylibacter sp.]